MAHSPRKKEDDIFAVGVDLGGTRLRAAAVDRKGRLLRRFETQAPPPERLAPALERLWRRWGLRRTDFLAVGSKGVWTKTERARLKGRLGGLAGEVRVLSDVELAFENAFTPPGRKPGRSRGVLVLAGTGSIALARDDSGRVARSGGLGPGKGDQGSGYWIGREYLRLKRGRTGRISLPTARVAALSETVLKGASRDPVCADILRRAQVHLAGLALAVAGKLRFKGKVPAAAGGGLFQNQIFLRGFRRQLRRLDPRFVLVKRAGQREPALAAAQWAPKLKPDLLKPFGYALPSKRR